MATDDRLKGLILTGVKLSDRVLGKGNFATVFPADYNGTTCAAKQLDDQPHVHKQNFLHECLLHSRLDHSNIVKMLGVHYPSLHDVPVLVMELMEYNLTTLLEKSQNIPMYVKLSIIQDISRGVHYLHTLNPPVVHGDLKSNNIVLTSNLVAKLYNFGVLDNSSCCRVHPYMEQNTTQPGLPSDVYLFGLVLGHVVTQRNPYKWPLNENGKEKFQHYFALSSNESLKQLAKSCLDHDPHKRPLILEVCGQIASLITGEVILQN